MSLPMNLHTNKWYIAFLTFFETHQKTFPCLIKRKTQKQKCPWLIFSYKSRTSCSVWHMKLQKTWILLGEHSKKRLNDYFFVFQSWPLDNFLTLRQCIGNRHRWHAKIHFFESKHSVSLQYTQCLSSTYRRQFVGLIT